MGTMAVARAIWTTRNEKVFNKGTRVARSWQSLHQNGQGSGGVQAQRFLLISANPLI